MKTTQENNMKHHQFKKIIKAIDCFADERNSPRKAESLRDLISLLDEYVVGTTSLPTHTNDNVTDPK